MCIGSPRCRVCPVVRGENVLVQACMSFMLVCFCRGSDRDDAAGVAHRRVNFTAEDDENLVHYMATVFPDTESGGRMGNKYYQELERLVRPSSLSSPCSVLTPPTSPRHRISSLSAVGAHTLVGRVP